METELKVLIADFFQKKGSFKSLLKTNPDKFMPIVFQEFTDTSAFQDFTVQQSSDNKELTSEADRVFASYVQTELNELN